MCWWRWWKGRWCGRGGRRGGVWRGESGERGGQVERRERVERKRDLSDSRAHSLLLLSSIYSPMSMARGGYSLSESEAIACSARVA